MSTYRNTRPTIIQRPGGKNVMPGDTFETEPGEMNNPGMRIFEQAGYVKKVADSAPPPPPAADSKADKDAEAKAAKAAKDAEAKAAKEKVLAEAAEKAGKAKRDQKIAAAKTADADALLSLADGETHPEVMAAIEARAAELAPKT